MRKELTWNDVSKIPLGTYGYTHVTRLGFSKTHCLLFGIFDAIVQVGFALAIPVFLHFYSPSTIQKWIYIIIYGLGFAFLVRPLLNLLFFKILRR
jgi:hypothetical protein